MDQTVTSLPAGKGSGELCSEPLLCCHSVTASQHSPCSKEGGEGMQKTLWLSPLACWPVSKCREELLCTSWVFSVLCLLHLMNQWYFITTILVLFSTVVAFSLLTAEGPLPAPDSIIFQLLVECCYQAHSNRLSESTYWSCCWNAKCD